MPGETLKIRVMAPDLWREVKREFAADTTVGDLKVDVLPDLLGKSGFDPAAFYVEYFEKEVLDESKTLADLEVPQNGVISVRQYDLDHPPPYEG